MGSFTQLTYHVVFATKYRRPSISDPICERLYEYIGGILRAKKGMLIEIGGTADHIHMLTRLSPVYAVADVIRDVKANSSKWVHELPEGTTSFAWQKGHGAFTVSFSQIETVRRYLRNQQQHHDNHNQTFQEEYIAMLEKHGIEYRLEYLFEDERHG